MANIGDFQNIRNSIPQPSSQSGQRSNLLAEFAKQMAGARSANNASIPQVEEKAIQATAPQIANNTASNAINEETPKTDKPFRKGMVLDIRV